MFRAFDPETERLVAVKLFTLDLAPERVHQLVAEFERLIAATLTHPAIAAPLATGIHDNRAYLAMDYVSADSLDVTIRQYGAAPPADALRVAAQLAGALDFAAVVNIAHGALHPRDVLLSPDETRLTGLGIARAFERVNVAAPVRRPYTPPEGIAGAEWDRRADVFSLAALMHELLWGRRVSATGAQAVASLTEIPGGDLDALRTLFARALAERAADRFDIALDFAQALMLAFPGVTIAAPQAGVAAPVPARPEVAGREVEPRVSLDEPAAAADVRRVKKISRARDDRESVERSNPEPDDLDLRDAEAARYQEVETAPAIVDLPTLVPPEMARPTDAPPGFISGYSDAPISALERSRSAVWPLALALIVGVAIGFAGGYGVGSRDHAPAAGREWTESAVNDGASSEVRLKPDTTETMLTPDTTEKTLKPETAETAPPAVASAPKSEISNLKSEIPSNGRLLVRSTPAGARVFVDGREEGRTPLAVRELARGVHRLRVVRDGYATEERRITITASRPAQAMTVPLLRARVAQVPPASAPIPATPGTAGRFVGALTVDSRPPGAEVFIDGKLAGTTPLQLAGLTAGEHVVRIARDGYRRWSSSVRVVAAEQNRVTASLEK